MAEKKQVEEEAVPVAAPIVTKTDPNTGQEVVVVEPGFGRHIKERGLDCPCKDC